MISITYKKRAENILSGVSLKRVIEIGQETYIIIVRKLKTCVGCSNICTRNRSRNVCDRRRKRSNYVVSSHLTNLRRPEIRSIYKMCRSLFMKIPGVFRGVVWDTTVIDGDCVFSCGLSLDDLPRTTLKQHLGRLYFHPKVMLFG